MDKIICVGKNYPAHAAELGDKQPDVPVLFLKPPSCLVQLSPASQLHLPAGEVHHELEVVLKIAPRESESPFSAFTLGLDLTRRDLQQRLKKEGQPWEIAKVFSNSAVVATWQPWSAWREFAQHPFQLTVNGVLRQSAFVKDMLWPAEKCLELAASYFPIVAGDLLFTGTPVGVGPLRPGDQFEMVWHSLRAGGRF